MHISDLLWAVKRFWPTINPIALRDCVKASHMLFNEKVFSILSTMSSTDQRNLIDLLVNNTVSLDEAND